MCSTANNRLPKLNDPWSTLRRIGVGLVLFVFAVVAFYIFTLLFFVPGYKARQFAEDFEELDFKPYPYDEFSTKLPMAPKDPFVKTVKAHAVPRTLDDFFHFQARVAVTVDWGDKANPGFDVTDDAEIVVAIGGLDRRLHSRTSAQ